MQTNLNQSAFSITDFYQNFISPLSTARLDIPGFEIIALLVILTICLVGKLTRSGIIIAYLFAYKWGWSIMVEHEKINMVWYLVFGMIVGVLTVVGMLRTAHLKH